MKKIKNSKITVTVLLGILFAVPIKVEAQNSKVDSMLKSARKTYSSGNTQSAIEAYWRILERAPEKLIAHLELGDIYLQLGMYDRAIELLEPALDNASKNNMDNEILCKYYCSLTFAYIALKNEGKANQYLIKAAQCSPKNPRPRVLLGDIYSANGKYSNAAKAYGQALLLDENYKPAADKLDLLIKKYGNKLRGNNKKVNIAKIDNKQKTVISDSSDEEIENENLAETQKREEYSEEETNYEEVSNDESEGEQGEVDGNSEEQIEDSSDSYIGSNETEANAETSEATSDETDQYYLDLLTAGEMKDKEKASAYFVHKGKDGLEKIEDLMYNANPDVRIIAVRTMARFTDCKKQVKTILLDFEDDNNIDVAAEVKGVLNTLEDVSIE